MAGREGYGLGCQVQGGGLWGLSGVCAGRYRSPHRFSCAASLFPCCRRCGLGEAGCEDSLIIKLLLRNDGLCRAPRGSLFPALSSESRETPGSFEEMWRDGFRMSHSHRVLEVVEGEGQILNLQGSLEQNSRNLDPSQIMNFYGYPWVSLSSQSDKASLSIPENAVSTQLSPLRIEHLFCLWVSPSLWASDSLGVPFIELCSSGAHQHLSTLSLLSYVPPLLMIIRMAKG